jgi:putative transposase
MPQSLCRVVVHLVFSTKNRKPWLRDPRICDELYRYVAATLKTLDCTPIKINGVEDHVHVLFGLSRNHPIKKIVGEVKSDSSKWIKTKGGQYHDFYWQSGYGIFSVSESKVAEVQRYIANQQEHHKKLSFQDEFQRICERHGVEIDERYVWD